jgi:hypothetical protein
MKEIRSAKQFIAFIVGFILSGAAWLAVCNRWINLILKRRK